MSPTKSMSSQCIVIVPESERHVLLLDLVDMRIEGVGELDI